VGSSHVADSNTTVQSPLSRVFSTGQHGFRTRPKYGVHKRGYRRALALYRLFQKAGIDVRRWRENIYPPGLWILSFPEADFKRAEAIADKCYVGESWWPTKGKPKRAPVRA
jgi:hypothetical protein